MVSTITIFYDQKYKQDIIDLTADITSQWHHLENHPTFHKASIDVILEDIGLQKDLFLIAVNGDEVLGYLYMSTMTTMPFEMKMSGQLFIRALVSIDNIAVKQLLLKRLVEISSEPKYSQMIFATGPAWGIDFDIVPTQLQRLYDIFFQIKLIQTRYEEVSLDDSLKVSVLTEISDEELVTILQKVNATSVEIERLKSKKKHISSNLIFVVNKDDTVVGVALVITSDKQLNVQQIIAEKSIYRQIIYENLLSELIEYATYNDFSEILLPDVFREKFTNRLVKSGFEKIPAVAQFVLKQ